MSLDHDQNKYWMWPRSRWINPRSQPPLFRHEQSWEEQAFAEDTLHIWPPRSYSCSFCRREFRSAQALGGHMNVHRRDRARLRQQPSSPNFEDQDPNNSVARLEQDGSSPNCNLLSYNYYSPPKEVFKPILDLNIGGRNLKRKIDDYEETVSKKRRCVGPEFHDLFVRGNSPVVVQKLQGEVTSKVSARCPIEELDLELRLGNCPKVN